MTTYTPEITLFELDKNEWRDATRILRPEITDDEFDQIWNEFCDWKRTRNLN